ncbi:MAG: NIL domain-containing protein [Candidatus Omnitrophota bacterium]|jgi:ferredoxin
MVSKRIVLHFPSRLVNQPIVYKLVKEYDLQFNILKAFVTPEEEGLMVLELIGKRDNFDKGVEYLQSCGVKMQPLSQDVVRNEAKCTNCGVCVPICPTEALMVDKETRKVTFDNKKCIACELCVKICPPRAMEVHF